MTNTKNLDPIHQWREWFATSEKQWSDALRRVMASEPVARSAGRMLHEALHAHRMWSEGMAQCLTTLNLPSRTDIVDVHERLAHVEKALDDIGIELREQRTQHARPQRTRRPAGASDS